jgi:hypothetical protein
MNMPTMQPDGNMGFSIILTVDVEGLLDPNAALAEDDTLRFVFLRQWINTKFADASQKELDQIEVIDMQLVLVPGSFFPDSYVAHFAEFFDDSRYEGLDAWLQQTAIVINQVTLEMNEVLVSDLRSYDLSNQSSLDMLTLRDLRQAFIYYVSGVEAEYEHDFFAFIPFRPLVVVHGENYSEMIHSFFAQYPELVAIREAFMQ